MNSQINPTNTSGGRNQPLKLFEPFNIIVYLSFFSPIILALGIVSLSFIFQNFKGFIYLGFLIGVVVVRSFIYYLSGGQKLVNDGTICTSIEFSQYGNATFSAFVFGFTIMYMLLPMFVNKEINFWIVGTLLTYFLMDIFIKMNKKCITKLSELFLNILGGLTSATLIVILMFIGGSGSYLFYNETASNNETCSMPSKQTFKCSVYKNGTLVSNL